MRKLLLLFLLSTGIARAQSTLNITCFEDYYLTDALASVTVDGIAVPGTHPCTARSTTPGVAPPTLGVITLAGGWSATAAHTVKVTFTNDAYGGSSATDRNLYVTAVSLNGTSATPVSYGRCGVTTTGIPQQLLCTNDTGSWTTAIVSPPNSPTLQVVSAVVSLSAPATVTHTVTLSWAASTSPGVTGYNIYRSTTSSSAGYTRVNSSPVTTMQYVDSNLAGSTTYYYVATAVTGAQESGYSNTASAVIP